MAAKGTDSTECMQVWNTNAYGAVVGVFNTQGASWDRARREFMEHKAPKAPLRALVVPADVPAFAGASDARYVAWVDSVQTACVLATYDSLHVTLARGQSDIITLLPLKAAAGISVAPIGAALSALAAVQQVEVPILPDHADRGALTGLVNMLNPSGAVDFFDLSVSTVRAERFTADVHVRGAGQLAVYCSEAPLRVDANGAPAAFQYAADRNMLIVEVPHGKGFRSQVAMMF